MARLIAAAVLLASSSQISRSSALQVMSGGHLRTNRRYRWTTAFARLAVSDLDRLADEALARGSRWQGGCPSRRERLPASERACHEAEAALCCQMAICPSCRSL